MAANCIEGFSGFDFDRITQRARWDRAGAVMSDEVEAYELVKLRLLNGSHSLIAYLGITYSWFPQSGTAPFPGRLPPPPPPPRWGA